MQRTYSERQRMSGRSALFFAGYFHPHVGGYERSILELSKRLASHGYRIEIVTLNTEASEVEESIHGFRVRRLDSRTLLDGRYPIPRISIRNLRVVFCMLKENYDVVVTHTRFMTTSLIGVLFAKLRGIKLIHTEHGSNHSRVGSRSLDLVSMLFDHTLGRFIVGCAFLCIAVSQPAADFIHHLGCKHVIVIHNGVDLGLYCEKLHAPMRGSRSQNSEVVITFVGRLVFGKGVQDVIMAIDGISPMSLGIRFVVVGDGPYRKSLQEIVRSRRIEFVEFVGQKSEEEIVAILSQTDIFINPSYSEGLPTAVLEAAWMGLPIIATDVGGTREIIENDREGILVSPGDLPAIRNAIIRLASDQELAFNLGNNAREKTISLFSWEKSEETFVSQVWGTSS